ELREQILSLTREPAAKVPRPSQARFAWSEYEQMVVADALGRGEKVYNLAFSIDPHCPMRSAALQLIRNILQECGRVLAIAPDTSALTQELNLVEAALASEHAADWIEKKCLIPAVVAEIVVQSVRARAADDVLGILSDTEPVNE